MLRCKGDNMIDETKLEREEAWQFIRCMEDELLRHKIAQTEASKTQMRTNSATVRRFYEYGEIRHQEDINMIQKTINYLKGKWDL